MAGFIDTRGLFVQGNEVLRVEKQSFSVHGKTTDGSRFELDVIRNTVGTVFRQDFTVVFRVMQEVPERIRNLLKIIYKSWMPIGINGEVILENGESSREAVHITSLGLTRVLSDPAKSLGMFTYFAKDAIVDFTIENVGMSFDSITGMHKLTFSEVGTIRDKEPEMLAEPHIHEYRTVAIPTDASSYIMTPYAPICPSDSSGEHCFGRPRIPNNTASSSAMQSTCCRCGHMFSIVLVADGGVLTPKFIYLITPQSIEAIAKLGATPEQARKELAEYEKTGGVGMKFETGESERLIKLVKLSEGKNTD